MAEPGVPLAITLFLLNWLGKAQRRGAAHEPWLAKSPSPTPTTIGTVPAGTITQIS